MEKFNRIAAPAGEKLRQIQKMVHDLKKNEGGIMQKIKKLTNRNPPDVPRRDYVAGNAEEEEEGEGETDEWSEESTDDDEYENPEVQSDSETYVVPSEDMCDDNYEPPPTEQEHKLHSSYSFSPGDLGYADKPGIRQLPSLPLPSQKGKPARAMPKPNPPFPKTTQPAPKRNQRISPILDTFHKPTPDKALSKPQFTPRPKVLPESQSAIKKPMRPPKQQCQEEEEYIVPGDEAEDDDDNDNYIEPTKDPPQPYISPALNTINKPVPPTPAKLKSPQATFDPAVYEVPESETTPPPPLKRESLPLPRRNSPPKIEQPCEEEYEPCNDNLIGNREETQSKFPSPLPRNGKAKPLLPKAQKPVFLPRDVKSNTDKPVIAERTRRPCPGAEHSPATPMEKKLPVPVPKSNVHKPPEVLSRHKIPPSRNNFQNTLEQEAGLLNKDWHVSSCDRKAAEEALLDSCKDGSFIIRKSSGQDSKQPYTLVVFYNRRVYNIPVRFIESTRQYALGREKSGEEKFSSIAEMIENHRRTPLVLIDSQNNTKDSTKLKQAVQVP